MAPASSSTLQEGAGSPTGDGDAAESLDASADATHALGPDGLVSSALPHEARTRPPPVPWHRMTVPLVALGAAGVSTALFIRIWAMEAPSRAAFLTGNALAARLRDQLLSSALAGGAFPITLALLTLLVARGRVAALVEHAGRILSPLIPICLLPALFNFKFSHQNQLTYLLVLAVFVVTFDPLLRHALTTLPLTRPYERLRAEFRSLRRLPFPKERTFFFILVLLASIGYAAFMSFFTIRNHHRLGTTAFDLGIYDNLMYNAIHGRLFESPVLFGRAGGNYLAGHAEFAMLLFIPFYAVRPGPETMLIIQAAVLGLAAVPLYLFASTRLPRPIAATVALAYLFFAPLHGPNFYDFHWIPLALFFHFWLYYAIANRKNWLVVVMVVVLFAVREDVAVGLAVLGLFLLFSGLRPRMGTLMAVASVAWFVIDRFVIMPLAGAWYFQNLYSALFAEGTSTFVSVIKTIVTNPLYTFGTLGSEAKLTYVGHMFVPLALLPCRRPQLLPLAVAGIFFTILTTGYSPTIQISFQYTTHWIPYLFLATVLALILVSRSPDGRVARAAALCTMTISMLAHSYNFGAFMEQEMFVGGFSRIEFRMSADDQRRYAELKELLAMIPKEASVAATEQETAHVSTRRIIYALRAPPGPVDYLLVGRSHIGDLSRSSLNAALANPNEYGLLAERGGELFLFKRGHVSPETPSARARLGVP